MSEDQSSEYSSAYERYSFADPVWTDTAYESIKSLKERINQQGADLKIDSHKGFLKCQEPNCQFALKIRYGSSKGSVILGKSRSGHNHDPNKPKSFKKRQSEILERYYSVEVAKDIKLKRLLEEIERELGQPLSGEELKKFKNKIYNIRQKLRREEEKKTKDQVYPYDPSPLSSTNPTPPPPLLAAAAAAAAVGIVSPSPPPPAISQSLSVIHGLTLPQPSPVPVDPQVNTTISTQTSTADVPLIADTSSTSRSITPSVSIPPQQVPSVKSNNAQQESSGSATPSAPLANPIPLPRQRESAPLKQVRRTPMVKRINADEIKRIINESKNKTHEAPNSNEVKPELTPSVQDSNNLFAESGSVEDQAPLPKKQRLGEDSSASGERLSSRISQFMKKIF